MVFLEHIEQDKHYTKLEHPIPLGHHWNTSGKHIGKLKCVGFFPYSTKRVSNSPKVNRELYDHILHDIKMDKRNNCSIIDNKIVLIFIDTEHFGTEYCFALFVHDTGCIVGTLDDIKPY